jgi:hypothetical protein
MRLATLLLLTLCSPASAGPEHAVYVRVPTGGDYYRCGSGTTVHADASGSYVLTCAHAVYPGEDAEVITRAAGVPSAHPARHVAGSPVANWAVWGWSGRVIGGPDLALLLVPGVRWPAAGVATEPPAAKAELRQWGYGLGYNGPPDYRQRPRSGSYVGVHGDSAVNTIPCVGGDSGCGVFDSADRLVPTPRGACGCVGCACESGGACESPQGCPANLRSAAPPRTLASARLKAQARGVPLLVVVGGPRCPACRVLDKTLAGMDLSGCVVYHLDGDADPAARERLRVDRYPTLVVMRAGGEVARHVGCLDAAGVRGLLNTR